MNSTLKKPARLDDDRWELWADAGSVALARERVTDFARGHGVIDRLLEDISLAASEAVSNVVVHAYPDARGEVVVEVSRKEDVFRLRVLDEGVGMRPRIGSPGLGLGLPLMGRLADDLDIQTGPGGKGTKVTMFFALEPPQRTSG